MSNPDKIHWVRWFEEVAIEDVPQVGGKNASLGEMYQTLRQHGILVPNGFAVTAEAYWKFLEKSGLRVELESLMKAGVKSAELGATMRAAILNAQLPTALQQAILENYKKLGSGKPNTEVAVRSSATAEDLPNASFAGQQETYLNVQGEQALLEACRRCYASLFTDRAVVYRDEMRFDHSKVALSIGIQQMVRSDLACSGVLFTLDTESGFRDVVLINASYGLGENIVQGIVSPDEFCVHKPTLREGYEPILKKQLGSKELKLVYDIGGGKQVRNIPVPDVDRVRFCLTDAEILKLARWGSLIEDHYSTKLKHPTPMDIEWAKDGKTGELFVVQARPETVQSRKSKTRFETFELKEKGKLLVSGSSVGDRIGTGTARVIRNVADLEGTQEGDVLVTAKTDPDWEPYMKKVRAIVTDEGGRTCHAAIVSRELGIPAVVGTGEGTKRIENGKPITVSCAEGEVGHVYAGTLRFEAHTIRVDEIPRTRTRIMLNVADPSKAFHQAQIPNDGVGLMRMEFVVTNAIKIHPMALIEYNTLEDMSVRRDIDEATRGYTDKKEFFIDKLAMGVGTIAAAFYPKDVILRFSDFKTNEYANLIGGKKYEPKEENPMLGFRGASRYYHPLYRDGFALECAAIRKVRETMGLTNLKTMIPFCRTVDEGNRVLEIMKANGLERGKNGLEVYMMCEIPSNVILAKEFALLFDGFSIGSNDLTQLVLGVDRDSSLVAPLFDERNPAVKKMLESVIHTLKSAGKKIGICGQAPSDFPEFAEFLVEQGIDSISLNPDAAIRVSLTVAKKETSFPT